MDDLIVIILTLIIAVVGAYGQMKKKSRQVAPGKSEPSGFWDVLLENRQDEPVIEASVAMPVQSRPTPVISPEGKGFITNEGSRSVEKKAIQEEIPTIPETHQRLTELDGFSLRKAVIYSEILNRKYV